MFKDRIQFEHEPLAHEQNILVVGNARFTLITDSLIRMEYSRENTFRDRSTQTFLNRHLGEVSYESHLEKDLLSIETRAFRLEYKLNDVGFTLDTLSVFVKSTNKTWIYGRNGTNLKGTIRTLDQTDGEVPLEDGLMSRDGYALVDDTASFVFTEDHWVEQIHYESGEYEDLYLFAYGLDYKRCLKDFVKVAGDVPMLPRWTMGNWWSRYWAYSQDELLDLMDEFKSKEIPLSVCIVDMDWHITDVHKTGKTPTSGNQLGWTGYTWDNDYFPNPEMFLKSLHERGLKTALNLHPADGLWPHESMYEEMATYLGLDTKEKKAIPFNITDPKFAEGYFNIMHHPHEKMGVDFWWMDWQQGTKTKFSDIDPLFVLNHLHFLDMSRENNRPFIFSRWGGLGNHRYPIGFSGDAAASWEGLAFQTYLTSTAANVGYGWWSHDIGGHHFGYDDGELYARWVQFGVFSPMMRLHSTKNIFEERLPWEYNRDVEVSTKKFMRLRHQLIPYLYNLSYQNHKTGIPGFLPMYYEHPDVEEAYHYGNQYYFGDLIVSPFVAKADENTTLSRQTVWLPEGHWYDFFTGEYYKGNHHYGIYGGLDKMPVFAKSGSIVPLNEEHTWGGIENPSSFEIIIFAGNGSYELYEDDGVTQAYLENKGAFTLFEQSYEDGELTIKVHPSRGETSLLPSSRDYVFKVMGIESEPIIIESKAVSIHEGLVMKVSCERMRDSKPRIVKSFERLLYHMKVNSHKKQHIWEMRETIFNDPSILGRYDYRNVIHPSIMTALLEIVHDKAIYHLK